jgi:hypothetical protein
MGKLIIPPPQTIATMIGTPNNDVNRWKGNCYCVASKMVKEDVLMTDCRAVYGHYLGPISSKSFFQNRRNMPFCQHGWIELPNGDIIDPTRWVFEAKEPYIALIDHMDDVAEEYDEGGNQWREATTNPPPEYSKKDKQFSFSKDDFDKLDGRTYVLGLLGDKRKSVSSISSDQLFWLANLSIDTLGIYAMTVYDYIHRMGCLAFVPLDNQIKIIGEEKLKTLRDY